MSGDLYSQYKQVRRSESLASYDVSRIAFPQQLAFIKDPARLKALFCTRRAAKSYTGGIYLFKEALENPGCNCLYIALTRDNAKSIIWKDVLKEIDRNENLNAKFNETELTATLPNGSVIKCTGCDTDEQEMNKLLGKKYKLVVLDEASMFTINVHQLVYGILKPATADQRGSICLLGTSSNITRGLFYDITTRKESGWSLHTWTAYDNPHVRTQWTEELEDIAKNRPHFQETPLFKQWYLNQWVIDEDAKVYKFNDQVNCTNLLPIYDGSYHFVLGIDLGHSPDPSAFVVSAYHPMSPVLYFIHAEKHLRMDVTDVATKIKELDAKYNFDVKVIDGSHKMAVEELNNRHKVNVIPADKIAKEHFINLMNTEFIQRRISVLHGTTTELQSEWNTLVWETENGKIKLTPSGARREHPGLPNHLTDAALYNWRYTYSYLHSPIVKPPDPHSWPEVEKRHIEKLSQQVQRDQNPSHWDNVFEKADDLFDFDHDDAL